MITYQQVMFDLDKEPDLNPKPELYLEPDPELDPDPYQRNLEPGSGSGSISEKL